MVYYIAALITYPAPIQKLEEPPPNINQTQTNRSGGSGDIILRMMVIVMKEVLDFNLLPSDKSLSGYL